MKKYWLLLAALLAFLLLVPHNAFAEEAEPFEDITPSHRFYDAILWAYSGGVTSGKTDTMFLPDASCTRAQVVTFLWRVNGCPAPTARELPFTDVSGDAYYADAVLWALEQGITTGKTETTFLPNEPVKREQFVTFLWRAAGKPQCSTPSPFPDVWKEDAYYYPAILWACGNGITNGIGGGFFGMGRVCTRGQTVAFLYRHYAGKPVTGPVALGISAQSVTLHYAPVQLTATLYPFSADQDILWASSDPAVVTVSQDGLLTLKGKGSALITAACGDLRAQCHVTCDPRLRIQIFGDSLSDNTWGDCRTWVDQLPQFLPGSCLTIDNRAVAGNTLTAFPASGGGMKGVAHQLLSQPGSAPDLEADIIIIFAGTNDWSSNVALGSPTGSSSATVFGAVESIISHVSASTDARLLFLTPVQRDSESDRRNCLDTDLSGNRLSSHGYTLSQYADAIRQTCQRLGAECLDLYTLSGITQDNIASLYASDGLHINEAGETIVAALVAGQLLNPGSHPETPPLCPGYDLHSLTDLLSGAPIPPLVPNGGRHFINRNHSGIRAALGLGSIRLRYQILLDGQLHTVTQEVIGAYRETDDTWIITDTQLLQGVPVQTTFTLKPYGMIISSTICPQESA